jgi:hypothetical protein
MIQSGAIAWSFVGESSGCVACISFRKRVCRSVVSGNACLIRWEQVQG